MTEPHLPFSICSFDRDPTRVGVILLYGSAAKAARIEINTEFLSCHIL